jgi:hypothetical protein
MLEFILGFGAILFAFGFLVVAIEALNTNKSCPPWWG